MRGLDSARGADGMPCSALDEAKTLNRSSRRRIGELIIWLLDLMNNALMEEYKYHGRTVWRRLEFPWNFPPCGRNRLLPLAGVKSGSGL